MAAAPPSVPGRPGRPSSARPGTAAPTGRPVPPAARAPISVRGAVDLSTYRAPAPPAGDGAGAPTPVGGPAGGPAAGGPAGPAGGVAPGSFTRVATEATFQSEVLEQSMTVPVVLDLWATWCEPCKQLSPVLERLADEYGGRFVLATVDVDAEQRIAGALQVQSIPTVVGVVAGQLVPLFAGALPEAQVRQVLEELIRVGTEQGLTGRAAPRPPAGDHDAAAEEPAEDPRFTAAYDAVEAGDYDAAVEVFRKLLAVEPGLPEAVAGLAQVSLLARTATADPDQVLAAAAADPADVAAGLAAADAEFVAGGVEAAFDRLVALVRATSGAERDRVRSRLLELFEVLGTDDRRVAAARVKLANALF